MAVRRLTWTLCHLVPRPRERHKVTRHKVQTKSRPAQGSSKVDCRWFLSEGYKQAFVLYFAYILYWFSHVTDGGNPKKHIYHCKTQGFHHEAAKTINKEWCQPNR